MKITIQIDNHIASVEDKSVVSLFEVLELMDQALKGAGFVYKGTLEIVGEGYDDGSKD